VCGLLVSLMLITLEGDPLGHLIHHSRCEVDPLGHLNHHSRSARALCRDVRALCRGAS